MALYNIEKHYAIFIPSIRRNYLSSNLDFMRLYKGMLCNSVLIMIYNGYIVVYK
ncbi:hypothetical protein FHW88_005123 [Mucilaginibacter sp. SG538B]|jgi:hypothetical protein|nr:hypothetical protein [Mucilaginibacter sp. SG538B]